jgi:hypothetical protein
MAQAATSHSSSLWASAGGGSDNLVVEDGSDGENPRAMLIQGDNV